MHSFRALGYAEVVENYLNLIAPHNIVVIGTINQKIDEKNSQNAFKRNKI